MTHTDIVEQHFPDLPTKNIVLKYVDVDFGLISSNSEYEIFG